MDKTIENKLKALRISWYKEKDPLKKKFIESQGKMLKNALDNIYANTTIRIYIPEELTKITEEAFGVKVSQGGDTKS